MFLFPADEIQESVLPEELRKYGLLPELIGGLPVIAGLDNLESDDLIPSPETPGFYFLLFISRKRRWAKNRLTMNPMKPIARKTIVTAATLSPAKEGKCTEDRSR